MALSEQKRRIKLKKLKRFLCFSELLRRFRKSSNLIYRFELHK